MHKVIALLIGLGAASPANAAVEYFDISNLAGFTQNGAAGIAGNGLVFLSPVYTVGYGATVDFGTAYIWPDFIDGRSGCGLTNSCFSSYGYSVQSFTDGQGSLSSAPFDLFTVGAGPFATSPVVEYCPNLACPAGVVSLQLTLPSFANTIQFAFEGSALRIDPPSAISSVPEPSTWAMILVGFVALGSASLRKSQRLRDLREAMNSLAIRNVIRSVHVGR